jgi:myo-inositol-1(or 4)-monophosphatase
VTGRAALAERFAVAVDLAREAGLIARAHFRARDRLTIEDKGNHSLVSEADREVEALIRLRLEQAFPGDGFLGEESGTNERMAADAGIWVVDPIDGTSCFLRGIPVWCVSIAFIQGGQPRIGVVYDPNQDEMFAGMDGAGATLNGVPMRAHPAPDLRGGVVGIGYSRRLGSIAPVLGSLERLVAAGATFQRNGSGALSIAYVAAGRLLGYVEQHINSWDCLAGILLVREAGGWTNDFLAGDGLLCGNPVIASGQHLKEAMLAVAGLPA